MIAAVFSSDNIMSEQQGRSLGEFKPVLSIASEVGDTGIQTIMIFQ